LKADLVVPKTVKHWALLALVVVYCQIALGGWTSTNYVALYCWDIPTCQGQWFPPTDFKEGFTLWSPGLDPDAPPLNNSEINYEGGRLSLEAGTAVHLTHRLGALVTLLVVGGLAIKLFLLGTKVSRRFSLLLTVTLGSQILLGLLNIILVLPISIAVAHNGGAAILLLALVTINRKITITEQVTKQVIEKEENNNYHLDQTISTT